MHDELEKQLEQWGGDGGKARAQAFAKHARAAGEASRHRQRRGALAGMIVIAGAAVGLAVFVPTLHKPRGGPPLISVPPTASSVCDVRLFTLLRQNQSGDELVLPSCGGVAWAVQVPPLGG